MSDAESRSEALAAATDRRIELKTAVSEVEKAASSPSAKPSWRGDLLGELDTLRLALDQHVREVEGQDGLLEEITELAPRLVHKIDQVKGEHPDLVKQVAEAIHCAESSDDIEHIRTVVVDSPHNGGRQLYLIEVSEITA